MDDFERQLILDFFIEATQLIDATEQALLSLERDKNNIDIINEIFRFSHTLKGSSRAVGFGQVAEFTHEVENVNMQLQKKNLQVTSAIVTLLLECNDHVRFMIQGLKNDQTATFESKNLLAKLNIIIPKK
jgi:two-component system chemotaxis sensor kinase CheA